MILSILTKYYNKYNSMYHYNNIILGCIITINGAQFYTETRILNAILMMITFVLFLLPCWAACTEVRLIAY